MKNGFLLAASAVLISTGSCGVHRLKLDKVSLSEQLEHASIAEHAKSLYNKYAGQKYMGIRPSSHREEMFRDTSIHEDEASHPVPVSNFLNAQCRFAIKNEAGFLTRT